MAMLVFPAPDQLYIRVTTSSQDVPAKFVPAGLLGRARIPNADLNKVNDKPKALTVVGDVLIRMQDDGVPLT
jgi:hypothetical protein